MVNSHAKIKHGNCRSIEQGVTKITAAKTKAKLRKIAGRIFFGKAMIRAGNKRLCNVLLGKATNGFLPDIRCRLHFQIQGISVRIQR